MNAEAKRSALRSLRSGQAFGSQDVVLALFVPILLALGIVYRYPTTLSSHASIQEHGVYRFRVVGRSLIVFVSNISGPLGRLAPGRSSIQLGWMVVNGLAFVGAAMLLWLWLRRFGGQHSIVLYVTILAVLIVSSTTITPYDFLSIDLFVALFWLATMRIPNLFAIAAVAALSIATREPLFVCVAAIVVVRAATGPVPDAASKCRSTLWLLSIPYLAVCFFGGIWNEAPRLLLPVLLGETLLALHATSTLAFASNSESLVSHLDS